MVTQRREATAARAESRPLVLPVIAFSDPNDLLSYSIPAGAQGFEDLRLVGVEVHVAKWAILGIFTNPLQAHRNYWTDPGVLRLINVRPWRGCRLLIDARIQGMWVPNRVLAAMSENTWG